MRDIADRADIVPLVVRGRVPALDGLRAIAVILVLVHHLITPWKFGGAVGVDIFFVLSGYLITSFLKHEMRITGTILLKNFYKKRIARLYPPLLVVIVPLSIPAVFVVEDKLRWAAETLFALSYTTPVALEIANGSSEIWRHTWTLGLEEFFYILWPLLLMLGIGVGRKGSSRGPLVLLCAAIGLAFYVYIDYADLSFGSIILRGSSLLVGSGLAMLSAHSFNRLKKPGFWVSGWFLLIASVAFETALPSETVSVVSASLATLFIIPSLVTFNPTGLARVLCYPPLVYIGDLSYELYLWHYPLLVLISSALDGEFRDVALVVLPSTFVLAILSRRITTPVVSWIKNRPPSRP